MAGKRKAMLGDLLVSLQIHEDDPKVHFSISKQTASFVEVSVNLNILRTLKDGDQ